jgi:hypothetical protein
LPYLTRILKTRLEVAHNDKHASLLYRGIAYSCKSFVTQVDTNDESLPNVGLLSFEPEAGFIKKITSVINSEL